MDFAEIQNAYSRNGFRRNPDGCLIFPKISPDFSHHIPENPNFLFNQSTENKTRVPMAFSKSHLFDPADQILSAFAKALSHPVRLDILRNLSKSGPCTVDALSVRYPLSKSTLSEHLENLRKSGLVLFKEEFPYTYYSLDESSFKTLHRRLLEYFEHIEE
jgi:DNA-binding transcriptional ArsR family regulator